ncbi:MAG TPA: UDP binding domain-containing protein, partial [Burkholderiaceae bacterium]
FGQDLLILRAVEAVNDKQKHVLGKKIVHRFGDDLAGRHFAIWGLAFKPNTDDMREASSRVLIGELVKRGATVAVYDPVAMEEARRCLALDFADAPQALQKIRFAESPMDGLADADALAIVTEWKAFRSPDFEQVKRLLKAPVIFDGRNLFEPSTMSEAGFEYHGIGRSVLTKA